MVWAQLSICWIAIASCQQHNVILFVARFQVHSSTYVTQRALCATSLQFQGLGKFRGIQLEGLPLYFARRTSGIEVLQTNIHGILEVQFRLLHMHPAPRNNEALVATQVLPTQPSIRQHRFNMQQNYGKSTQAPGQPMAVGYALTILQALLHWGIGL